MTTCWLVKDPVANPLVLESIPWWSVETYFWGAYLHMRFLFIPDESILIPDELVKRPHFLQKLGVVSIHFFAE